MDDIVELDDFPSDLMLGAWVCIFFDVYLFVKPKLHFIINRFAAQ